MQGINVGGDRWIMQQIIVNGVIDEKYNDFYYFGTEVD